MRILKLLSKAFDNTLPSASNGAPVEQRQALIYIVVAAAVPGTSAMSGLPPKLKRQWCQGVRR